MRRLFLSIIILLFPLSLLAAADLHIGDFSAGDLSGWTEKTFKGKTTYDFVKDGDTTVLHAHCKATASGLFKKVTVSAAEYPILRWRWKIAHTLHKEDVTTKKGDDFAARVYAVFPRTFFWQTRAIMYVWSAKMPKDSVAPNPYTGKVQIIAVESGDGKAGQWVSEERNILEDYRKVFHEEPPKLGAIALMTDTDDTGEEAEAWYGDIFLSPRPAH